MPTINRDNRNILINNQGLLLKKNKEINKTSKSVSELVDTIGKKSDCRMVLSGSCFEVAGSHAILKNLK